MVNEFEALDKLLSEKYGVDPALAVVSHDKVSTTAPFSLEAAPVRKDTIPAAEVAPILPEQIESPFIVEPEAKADEPEEVSESDWQDNAEDLVDIVDTLQAGIFGFVAKAKGKQKEVFYFSSDTKRRLSRKTKPVAKKHNIKAPVELSLVMAMGEALATNIQVAMEMRELNIKTQELTERAEKAEAALAASKA